MPTGFNSPNATAMFDSLKTGILTKLIKSGATMLGKLNDAQWQSILGHVVAAEASGAPGAIKFETVVNAVKEQSWGPKFLSYLHFIVQAAVIVAKLSSII